MHGGLQYHQPELHERRLAERHLCECAIQLLDCCNGHLFRQLLLQFQPGCVCLQHQCQLHGGPSAAECHHPAPCTRDSGHRRQCDGQCHGHAAQRRDHERERHLVGEREPEL